MNDYAVTRLGPPNYAGAMVPYQQQAPVFAGPPPDAMDVYTPPSDGVEYRDAEPEEIAAARGEIIDTLNYFSEHRLWGRPTLFTKACVAERFRDLLRNMAFGDVLFAPEAIFDALDIHESCQVKSIKSHLQNLIVDRNKKQADCHR